MKSIFTTIILAIILSSCEETHDSPKSTITTQQEIEDDKQVDNALNFINAYVDYANNIKTIKYIPDWIDSVNLCTEQFQAALQQILDDAYKQDPEFGLGFDPIFDAQDYPDKGFELLSVDDKANYVVVKGIDWSEFHLAIKMVNRNGNWLIDGCGIVNMPKN